MQPIRFIPAATAALALAGAPIHAVETPFTPFKDGSATTSTFTGLGRTLPVRAGDSKAWLVHALPASGVGVIGARLDVYVKDVPKDGQLRAYLATSIDALENQTHLSDLKAGDSLGTVALKASEHIQRVVSIPLSAAFLKALSAGTYSGIILEGIGGLDAELGALEGSHGAILFLDHAAGTAIAESTLVDSVAAQLASAYREALRGPAGAAGAAGAAGVAGAAGANGSNGSKGDKGDTGIQGPQGVPGSPGAPGAKGDRGERGPAGDATNLDPVFRVLLDRGQAALYRFDRFQGLPQTTPDSSGNGNTLSLSISGFSKSEIAAGDSAVVFSGSGYASVQHDRSLSPYREITLSARIRLSTENPPDTQTVVSKPNQYEMAVIGNKLRCRFKTALGSWEWLGDGDVPVGTWLDVQATYDGRAVRTFVNGAQKFHRFYSNGPLTQDTASRLYVGARDAGVAGLSGSMNDVKILSYAVGAQDSVSTLPGRVTRAQLAADSVSGLTALLDAKASVSGASFTGKVRVGAGTPVAEFEVLDSPDDADARADVYLRGSTGGGGVLRFYENTVERATIRADVDQGHLEFQSGGSVSAGPSEKMRITADGNVGIGTTTPAGKLAIAYADSGVTGPGQSYRGLAINTNFSGPGNPVSMGLDVDVRGPGLAQRWGAMLRGGMLGIIENEGDMIRMSGPTGNPTENLRWSLNLDGQGKLGIRQLGNGWTDEGTRLTLDRDGDLGLGTTDPSGRLNIASSQRSEMIGMWGGGLDGSTYQRFATYVDTGYHVLFEAPKPGNLAANRYDYWFSHRGDGLSQPRMVLKGSGSVGIGTASPAANLQVNDFGSEDDARPKFKVGYGTPDSNATVTIMGNDGNKMLQVWDDNNLVTPRMVLTRFGRLGLDVKEPGTAYLLDINGAARNTTGVWASSSDARLKKDIQPIQGALETVKALQGVEFNWRDAEKDRLMGRQKGFIAQDVERVIPEWVRTGEDGYKSLEKVGAEALLVEAIKDLSRRMDAQQAQIDALKAENEALKSGR